jgi:hypothetical protein
LKKREEFGVFSLVERKLALPDPIAHQIEELRPVLARHRIRGSRKVAGGAIFGRQVNQAILRCFLAPHHFPRRANEHEQDGK